MLWKTDASTSSPGNMRRHPLPAPYDYHYQRAGGDTRCQHFGVRATSLQTADLALGQPRFKLLMLHLGDHSPKMMQKQMQANPPWATGCALMCVLRKAGCSPIKSRPTFAAAVAFLNATIFHSGSGCKSKSCLMCWAPMAHDGR